MIKTCQWTRVHYLFSSTYCDLRASLANRNSDAHYDDSNGQYAVYNQQVCLLPRILFALRLSLSAFVGDGCWGVRRRLPTTD